MEEHLLTTYTPVTPGAEYVYLHGWFMFTAWSLLAFIQIASNRWFKSFWWIHMWVHRITGFLIFCITVGFGLRMIQENGWTIIQGEPPEAHFYIGVVMISVIGVLMVGGIWARSYLNRAQWNTNGLCIPNSVIKSLAGYYLYQAKASKYQVTKHTGIMAGWLTHI